MEAREERVRRVTLPEVDAGEVTASVLSAAEAAASEKPLRPLHRGDGWSLYAAPEAFIVKAGESIEVHPTLLDAMLSDTRVASAIRGCVERDPRILAIVAYEELAEEMWGRWEGGDLCTALSRAADELLECSSLYVSAGYAAGISEAAAVLGVRVEPCISPRGAPGVVVRGECCYPRRY